MTIVLEVQRWCPKCEKVFTATRTVMREGPGASELVTESPCPECGTDGQLLLEH